MRIAAAKHVDEPFEATRTSAQDLAPSNLIGAGLFALTSIATLAGLWLSVRESVALWLAGQLVLAIALLQWFILLHEAGHHTLFRGRVLNILAGHLAGALALIPFASWRRVHGLHHVWTGWQDLDPTTQSLTPRARTALQLRVTDLAWRYWLPLFSLVYRLSNYWHLVRLQRLFPAPEQRRALLLNAGLLVVLYAALVAGLGSGECLQLFGLALLLSLMLQDPLILSQHTHIPQQLSRGQKVSAFCGSEQERYTRSLRFPVWVSRWIVFGFEQHAAHHRLPAVPGYRLQHIATGPDNSIDWWSWLRAAKRVRGSVLLFETSATSGFRG